MGENAEPLDGRLWGQWVRGGRERWEVVRRSWSIFVLNTNELVQLLKAPSEDLATSLKLMNGDPTEVEEFWSALDQRLHNQLAGAVSLVDHTRRLIDYYEPDFPTFAEEYGERNSAVIAMNEAVFLRRLRNYLLHYGAAPLLQTFELNASAGMTKHSIKLSAKQLVMWDDWDEKSRTYLQGFPDRDGPVLGQLVATYSNAMSQLFDWLFDQDRVIHDGKNAPHRLRVSSPRSP